MQIARRIHTWPIWIGALFLGFTTCAQQPELDEDWASAARNNMVESQLQRAIFGRQAVKEKRVLDAMRTVPRHRFVPENIRRDAYKDTPLPIGHGQTISQPYIVARMTESLDLKRDERVLEIGTGSGYQAAVLAELVKDVFTIEIVSELGRRAESTLDELGYDNVHVRIGDGYKGWPEAAPFDAIIVTAAPDHVPQPLIDQLKPGGRMIIPVGPEFRVQRLLLVTKDQDGTVRQQELDQVRFVPFTGEAQERQRD